MKGESFSSTAGRKTDERREISPVEKICALIVLVRIDFLNQAGNWTCSVLPTVVSFSKISLSFIKIRRKNYPPGAPSSFYWYKMTRTKHFIDTSLIKVNVCHMLIAIYTFWFRYSQNFSWIVLSCKPLFL